jgi:hypothetical protein
VYFKMVILKQEKKQKGDHIKTLLTYEYFFQKKICIVLCFLGKGRQYL